jgi:hypothetical protein
MKKINKFVFPGLGLIASLYASISFAVGAVVAFFATELFIKKYLKTGRVKEVRIGYKDWEIHMHHWLMASAVIGGVYLTHDLNSIPTLALGFLNGLIFHDIYTHNKWKSDDKKWYQFIYKKQPL